MDRPLALWQAMRAASAVKTAISGDLGLTVPILRTGELAKLLRHRQQRTIPDNPARSALSRQQHFLVY